MIETAVFVRLLENRHVLGLLHNADHSAISPAVTTDLTRILFGVVSADGTGDDTLLDVPDLLGKFLVKALLRTKKVIG